MHRLYDRLSGAKEFILDAGGLRRFCDTSDKLDFVADPPPYSGPGKIVASKLAGLAAEVANLRKANDQALEGTQRLASTVLKLEQQKLEAETAAQQTEVTCRRLLDFAKAGAAKQAEADEKVAKAADEKVKKAELKAAQAAACAQLGRSLVTIEGCVSLKCNGVFTVKGTYNGWPHLENENGYHLYRYGNVDWHLNGAFAPDKPVCVEWIRAPDGPLPEGKNAWQVGARGGSTLTVTVAQVGATTWQWECEVDSKWVPFEPAMSDAIETAYHKKQTGRIFTREKHDYTIDWSLMLQINEKTQVKRSLRRNLVAAPKAVGPMAPASTTPVEETPFGNKILKYTITHGGATGFAGSFEEHHFGRACAQFHQMQVAGPRSGVRITSVDYYENRDLEKRFEDARQSLSSKNEEWVFHGTSIETARNMMQEGFLVGGVDTSAITGRLVAVSNGAQFGTGIYTARGPGAPVQYAAREAGSKCVILAKALLGSHIPDASRGGGADSWSPPGHGGDWAVFARKELLLPCYLVHYE